GAVPSDEDSCTFLRAALDQRKSGANGTSPAPVTIAWRTGAGPAATPRCFRRASPPAIGRIQAEKLEEETVRRHAGAQGVHACSACSTKFSGRWYFLKSSSLRA